MDIQLPKVSGYDAARPIKSRPELRAIPVIPVIPVIAVTSYALSGDDQKAREAGCDDYIIKAGWQWGPHNGRPHRRGRDSMSGNRAILVADDIPRNVRILRDRLATEGYRVVEASE